AIPVSCHLVEAGAWPEAVHLVAAGHAPQSPHLASLFSFRDRDLLHNCGLAGATQLFLGTDTAASYPPASDWAAVQAERDACLAYAEASITIAAIALPPATPDFGRDLAILAAPNGHAILAEELARRFAADPHIALLDALLLAIIDRSAALPAMPDLAAEDAFWWRNIVHVRAMHWGAAPRGVIDIGQEHDCLASITPTADWPLLRWLNMLAMRQLQPAAKVAVMVMATDDGINLIEWIAHHQAIGVPDIFVYTNDNTDGSDPLLAALVAAGTITLVHQRSAPGAEVQIKALRHAVELLPEMRRYEWVLFVEAGEFTIPDSRYDHSLPALLRAAGDAAPGAMLLPWHWRCWPHRFDRAPGMMLTRFPHAMPHIMFKAATRLASLVAMHMIDAPELDAGVAVIGTDLVEIPAAQIWDRVPKPDAGGSIQHFWGKSFVEFVIKKQCDDRLQPATGMDNHAFAQFRDRNHPMTMANLHPVPSMVIARTRAAMERLLADPAIAAAAKVVEANFTARAAAITGDPTLREVFASLSDPITPLNWAADDVGQTTALLHRPDGVARLAGAMARRFPNGPGRGVIGAVLAAIRDPAVPLTVVETDDSQVRLWVATIAAARAQRLGLPRANVLHLGADHDFIADLRAPQSWSVWQWLGVLALRPIVPDSFVAAMVSVRNEGINLLEWIAHYQAIGVDRIIVYANDCDDGSDDLLIALARHDVIFLVLQRSDLGNRIQRRTLQHALLMLPELRRSEWVLFVDADEYVVPDAIYDHQIAPLLAKAGGLPTRPGALLLPWRRRLWPHYIDRPAGMTLANYPHALPNHHFKAAIRPAVATGMYEVHFPYLDPAVPIVDSAHVEQPASNLWSEIPKSDAGGRVEHVWARSFADFVIKRQRGYSGGLRSFDLFAEWNGRMAADNLQPVEPLVIDRTREKLQALLAIPDIAAAAARVAEIYAARVASIAADPELRAIFDAMPNPNGEQAG
ncbi:MAG: glycosyltransferase family 2 protein, partial [Acetobacteraceae bacterium]|nr:glycosyltransferase family 2 protein [Acetobacteraceae bacterium]